MGTMGVDDSLMGGLYSAAVVSFRFFPGFYPT